MDTMITNDEPRHLTVKRAAWARQAGALGAGAYRISSPANRRGEQFGGGWNIADRGDDLAAAGIDPAVPAADRDMLGKRLFSAGEVERLLPGLAALNAQGYDIHVTPQDRRYHYLVLDDVAVADAKILVNGGWRPVLVQRTSPHKHQLIFRLPRGEIRRDLAANDPTHPDYRAAQLAVRAMNRFASFDPAAMAGQKPHPEDLGDRAVASWQQPFKLAGSYNRKLEYEISPTNHPAVMILYSDPRADCPHSAAIFAAARVQAIANPAAAHGPALNTAQTAPATGHELPRGAILIAAAAARRVAGAASESERDFARAAALARSGYSDATIAAVLIRTSPDLRSRHGDTQRYLADTVTRARAAARPERMAETEIEW